MRFAPAPHHPVHAISVLVSQKGKFLLIRRAKAPFHHWLSFPGGRVEPGETATAAAIRELREETALSAGDVQHLITLDLQKQGEAEKPYFLSVYHGLDISGQAQAGDDASALIFLSLDEMEEQKEQIIPSVLEVARHFSLTSGTKRPNHLDDV